MGTVATCPQEGVSPRCRPPPVSQLCGCHVSSDLSLSRPGPTVPPATFPSWRQSQPWDGLSSSFNRRRLPKGGNLQPGPQGVSFLPRCSLIISLYKARPAAGGLGFRTVVFLTTMPPRGDFHPPVAHSGHVRWWEQDNNIRVSIPTLEPIPLPTGIAPEQREAEPWLRKGLCVAEGGRTPRRVIVLQEMGHFPENFQPGSGCFLRWRWGWVQGAGAEGKKLDDVWKDKGRGEKSG